MRPLAFTDDERAELAALRVRIEAVEKGRRILHAKARAALVQVDPIAARELELASYQADRLYARKHEIEGAEASRFLDVAGLKADARPPANTPSPAAQLVEVLERVAASDPDPFWSQALVAAQQRLTRSS